MSIQTRLESRALPPWNIVPTPTSDTLGLTKLRYEQCAADVVSTVTLTTELLWSVALCGNLLNSNKILSIPLPPLIHSLSDLTILLSALDSARLCIGNSEQSFIEVVKH